MQDDAMSCNYLVYGRSSTGSEHATLGTERRVRQVSWSHPHVRAVGSGAMRSPGAPRVGGIRARKQAAASRSWSGRAAEDRVSCCRLFRPQATAGLSRGAESPVSDRRAWLDAWCPHCRAAPGSRCRQDRDSARKRPSPAQSRHVARGWRERPWLCLLVWCCGSPAWVLTGTTR
jgi:hypothetical protein